MSKKVFNMAGGKHSAAAYAAFENRLFGSCKASKDSFVVSAGSGMNASISAGDGLIDTGSNYARRIQTDAAETVAVAAASGSFNRLDSVVAYIDTDVTPTTSVTDNTNDILKFASVAGTAAATPVAPTGAAILSAIGAGKPYMIIANILVPQSAANLSGATFIDMAPLPPFVTGWRNLSDAWAYSSWDSTRKYGVITVPDSSKFTIGQKVRIYQMTGGFKFGFIMAKPNGTSIGVYFGNNYTLNNEVIFLPAYSFMESPEGFDRTPSAWTRDYVLGTTTAGIADSAWRNTASAQLALCPGSWKAEGCIAFQINGIEMKTAMSLLTGAPDDYRCTTRDYLNAGGLRLNNHRYQKVYTSTSNILIYLIQAGGGAFDMRGDAATPQQSYITAVPAFL